MLVAWGRNGMTLSLRWIWVVAVVCVLTLVAGVSAAVVRVGGEAVESGSSALLGSGGSGGEPTVPGDLLVGSAPISASPGAVAGRAWPERVLATRGWSAAFNGAGDRIVVSAPGIVVDGLAKARFRVESVDPRAPVSPTTSGSLFGPNVLALPDGSRWYPQGEFGLDAPGDLTFPGSPRPGIDLHPSLVAEGAAITVPVVTFEGALAGAKGPVTAVGSFVHRDGRQVERLGVPAESRLVEDCPPRTPQDLSVPCAGGATGPVSVTIAATDGLTVTVAGNGEIAVAGSATAGALGRSWDGQVVAVEAGSLAATARYQGGNWSVAGEGRSARQVWVDVWPVVDTVLSARSVSRSARDGYDLRIQWTNTGFASSQVFQAEGRGSGAPSVGFDLNKTSGHDAGLGVRRGDEVFNLDGGGDIDSNLAPGDDVNRGLSYAPGTQATIVLRGNFADVAVPLAIPAS